MSFFGCWSDLEKSLEKGVTEVYHDSMENVQIDHCEEVDCFNHLIDYPTSSKQLVNLIDLSQSCTLNEQTPNDSTVDILTELAFQK